MSAQCTSSLVINFRGEQAPASTNHGRPRVENGARLTVTLLGFAPRGCQLCYHRQRYGSDGSRVGTFTGGRDIIGPLGLAFDAAHIWVGNFQGNSMDKL
jgi:hypothetical protein